MRLSSLAPAGKVRVGLRARLAIIYGASFLVAGAVLTALMYLLVVSTVNAKFTVRAIAGHAVTRPEPAVTAGPARPAPPIPGGVLLTRKVAEQRQDVLDGLLRGSALSLITLCVLATVLGYLIAGRTLRPLHTVTATARRLSESTLHERIGLTGPDDEIKDLADTFDGMLDRLHRAFDSQRRFIANASHELRTPLAISRASIEVALAKPAVPEETRALATKLLGATARHERLIEGLLLLARSEREVHEHAPVDVRDAAAAAVGQAATAASEAGVTVDAELSPAATSGDPVLLERCVVNLVENAVKYNEPGGRVGVRSGTADGWAWVRVENTGPELTDEQVETIFEPFTRLTRAGTGPGPARGAGLGLSIVRAVTAAHDGVLRAAPRPGGGMTITVHLPPPVVVGPPEPEPAGVTGT